MAGRLQRRKRMAEDIRKEKVFNLRQPGSEETREDSGTRKHPSDSQVWTPSKPTGTHLRVAQSATELTRGGIYDQYSTPTHLCSFHSTNMGDILDLNHSNHLVLNSVGKD